MQHSFIHSIAIDLPYRINFNITLSLGSPGSHCLVYFLEAALARSARASRRLNLASSMTPGAITSTTVVQEVWHRPTCIGIAREVATPSDERLPLVLARRNGVEPDCAYSRCVTEGGLRRDDAVCDVVIDGLWSRPFSFNAGRHGLHVAARAGEGPRDLQSVPPA